MSRLMKALWLSAMVALPGLTACELATATPDPAAAYTRIAQTVIAGVAETATAGASIAVPTSAAPTSLPQASPTSASSEAPTVNPSGGPTDTPQLNPTPASGSPTLTPQIPFSTPKPTGLTPCDNTSFPLDVTFPDGTAVAPNEVFVKTWRFTNLGPCPWNTNYHLAYAYGGEDSKWNSLTPVRFPKDVNPGETVDISVTLQAPGKVGGAGAYFRLQNDRGYYFGPFFAAYVVVK